MRSHVTDIIKVLFSIGLCTWFVAAGCGSSDDDDEEEETTTEQGPPPPSSNTLAIDMDLEETQSSLTTTAGLNFLSAAVVTLAVNTNVVALTAIPAYMLKTAASVTPTKQADGSWLFDFDATNSGASWSIDLTAAAGATATASTWTMVVTRSPLDSNQCCTNFTFVTGSVTGTGQGTWQVYDPRTPADAENLFQVTYDVTDDTVKTLKYLFNSSKAATEAWGNGSYVQYVGTSDNVTLTVSNSAESGTHTIVWDRTTKAGSYTKPDTTKVCWDAKDANFADKTCE